ncbi:hypothetical protein ACFU6M_36595 [Streptomyces bottropensis]|uniref:Uncharacterized protein n=1 Tax=Streptomyces bottropensis TaxID=42235 RepID=A0ABU8AYQ5_9ACTN
MADGPQGCGPSDLADRFRARFWVCDQQGPYPAMGLDGSGRPVDSVTSNMGHLLATGILNVDETVLPGVENADEGGVHDADEL